jgi:hypothetical protein
VRQLKLVKRHARSSTPPRCGGIVFRSKSNELLIMHVTSSDSIEILKPKVLEVAKFLAPKLK